MNSMKLFHLDDYSYQINQMVSRSVKIIVDASELALESNALFYELAYTHIKHPICL